MSLSSLKNGERVSPQVVYDHRQQHVNKSSLGSVVANRFRRRPTSLHIPVPTTENGGTGNISLCSSKASKTSTASEGHGDTGGTGGGRGDEGSSSSSVSSIPSSSMAIAHALSGLTPSSAWYNNQYHGSDGEGSHSSALRPASRCDSQPIGRVSLSPSPSIGHTSTAILSPLLNAATRAIGGDMEVFQLTTANPMKSTTTSMYYSSDLNLNIQIGDQDEIELVGRKSLVGQHTHLHRLHHQIPSDMADMNTHHHPNLHQNSSISLSHLHSHSLRKG